MNSVHTRISPLDSRQLNAFVSLARTGSFKETAGELCLTHSAVSHAMRNLERELGCRLLTRMSKRVVLTQMGEALLQHAERGLKEFTKAREMLDRFKQWGAPQLRVGAGAAVSRQLLPMVFRRARQEDPRLRLTVRAVRPWEMAASLAREELDLVLGEPQKTIPEIAFNPLFDSPLQIVVAPAHRWALKGKVAAGELAAEPCLLTSKSHPTRQLIDRYFEGEGIELNVIGEIDSFDAIKEMVNGGTAISVLPSWVMQEELAAGKLRAFSPGRRGLQQTWGLYRWRSRPVTAAENSFRILCEEAGVKLTKSSPPSQS